MSFANRYNYEKDLLAAATARGAQVIDRGNGHFQIKGRLLVNYYPFSKTRTAYVAGTLHGDKHVSPTQAVAMAFDAPPMAREVGKRTDKRSSKTRRIRTRLIARKGPGCHWCQSVLTLDTSTIDHVIPIARGGLDNDNNRVLSCEPCNTARGHAMPELRA